ncbi:MAG: RNB domain-containing ribonuclease [Bacteriovoracia bacterium]
MSADPKILIEVLQKDFLHKAAQTKLFSSLQNTGSQTLMNLEARLKLGPSESSKVVLVSPGRGLLRIKDEFDLKYAVIDLIEDEIQDADEREAQKKNDQKRKQVVHQRVRQESPRGLKILEIDVRRSKVVLGISAPEVLESEIFKWKESLEKDLATRVFIDFQSEQRRKLESNLLKLADDNGVIRDPQALDAGPEGSSGKSNIEIDPFDRIKLPHFHAFTIDGKGTSTRDDAFSFKLVGNDLEVSVHIVDLTRLVQFGSRVDKDALEKGGTQFGHKRISMLPVEIADSVSFMRDKTSPAITGTFTISRKGEVSAPRFYRSTVRIEQTYTFEQLQSFLPRYLRPFKKVAAALVKEQRQDRTSDRDLFAGGIVRGYLEVFRDAAIEWCKRKEIPVLQNHSIANFTSPLRYYVDLFNLRQMSNYLAEKPIVNPDKTRKTQETLEQSGTSRRSVRQQMDLSKKARNILKDIGVPVRVKLLLVRHNKVLFQTDARTQVALDPSVRALRIGQLYRVYFPQYDFVVTPNEEFEVIVTGYDPTNQLAVVEPSSYCSQRLHRKQPKYD